MSTLEDSHKISSQNVHENVQGNQLLLLRFDFEILYFSLEKIFS